MSKEHDDDVRGFCHNSQSWYWDVNPRSKELIDEVMIGYYSPEGGTSGEFAVRWENLGGIPTPRLEAYCDSWHALVSMPDLLSLLSGLDESGVSPKRLCELLLGLGFTDLTQRQPPAALRAGPAGR